MIFSDRNNENSFENKIIRINSFDEFKFVIETHLSKTPVENEINKCETISYRKLYKKSLEVRGLLNFDDIYHPTRYTDGSCLNFNDFFKYVYRGLRNSNYKLIPSLYRDNILDCEYNYIDIEKHITIEDLGKKQHSGNIATRLMDVTKNPYVALFFSCREKLGFDGAVYIFLFDFEFNASKRRKIKDLVESIINTPLNEQEILKFKLQKLVEKADDNLNAILSDELLTDLPIFSRNLNEHARCITEYNLVDFYSVVYFDYSDEENIKMKKQEGLFITCCIFDKNDDYFNDIMFKIFGKYKLVIDRNAKSEILKELNKMGINAKSLGL